MLRSARLTLRRRALPARAQSKRSNPHSARKRIAVSYNRVSATPAKAVIILASTQERASQKPQYLPTVKTSRSAVCSPGNWLIPASTFWLSPPRSIVCRMKARCRRV
jgi:hypothetical protein